MNCELSSLLSIGLLSASFACSTSTAPQQLERVLTDSQYDIYEEILIERSTIYLQGILIGILVASVVSSRIAFDNSFHDIAFFTGVSWAVAVLYYLAIPKTKYMLPYLSEDQISVWHNVHVTMRQRYIVGGILGMLAAIPIATMACR